MKDILVAFVTLVSLASTEGQGARVRARSRSRRREYLSDMGGVRG